jgi:hypothetical protein
MTFELYPLRSFYGGGKLHWGIQLKGKYGSLFGPHGIGISPPREQVLALLNMIVPCFLFFITNGNA